MQCVGAQYEAQLHVFDFSFRYVYLIDFCLFDAVSSVSDSLFNELDNWASYDAHRGRLKEEALMEYQKATEEGRSRRAPRRFASSQHSAGVDVTDLSKSPPTTPANQKCGRKRSRRSLQMNSRRGSDVQQQIQNQRQTKKHHKLSEAYKKATVHDLAVRERRVDFQSTEWWARNANNTEEIFEMVWDTLNNAGSDVYTFCEKMADMLGPEKLRLLVANSQDKILMALEQQVSEASAALLKTKKALVKHEKKFKLENSAVFNSPIPIGHVDLVSPEQSEEDSESFGKKTPVQTTPGSKTAATPGSVDSDEPTEAEMRREHNIPNDNYPFPEECIERTDPQFTHKAHYVRGHGKSGYKGVMFMKKTDTYRIKIGGMSGSRHNTLQAACEAYAKLAGYVALTSGGDDGGPSGGGGGGDPSGGDDGGPSGGGGGGPPTAGDDGGPSGGGDAPDPTAGDDAVASGGGDAPDPDPTGGDDAGASGGGDAPDPDPTGAASGGGDVSPPYLNPADLPPSKRPRC